MGYYEGNDSCILAYLALFQELSAPEVDQEACQTRWTQICRQEESTPPTISLAPRSLRERLGLCERDFLLAMAALALEMDGSLRSKFRNRYGLPLPTLEYGLQLISPICPSGVGVLAELAGPSVLCGLILAPTEGAAYPMERPLILCRNGVSFLTGLEQADTPGCTLLAGTDTLWEPLWPEALSQMSDWYQNGWDHPLYLWGPAGSGRKTLLRRACGPVAYGNLSALDGMSRVEQRHALQEMGILARLAGGPLCVRPPADGGCLLLLEELCRQQAIPLAVLAEDESQLSGAKEVVRLPERLPVEAQAALWHFFAPEALPQAYPQGAMTVGALEETARLARRLAAQDGRDIIIQEDVAQAIGRRGGAWASGFRQDPTVTLEDMVLPPAVLSQLERVCQAAMYGRALTEEWGLPQRQEGVTAVFHGPSGTGKTMAASAIANRLGRPLLRADLSQIMDKYVGETEKHLEELFRCARESHSVLLFDEADSLFGRRADVSSGQDKYANLSTSYLLQAIEAYDGVALLSTNLLAGFDDAFLRRLDYVIRFQLPGPELREALWRRALPEGRRGELPFDLLAQVELSPARINSVAWNGALAALEAGRKQVGLSDVLEALRQELEKNSKAMPGALLRAWEENGRGFM